MNVVLTSAPAMEPVSPDDVKALLTSATDTDDTLISCLITAARIVCEARTGLVCLSQAWTLILETWPANGESVRLPISPVRRVTSVHVRKDDGRRMRVDETRFRLANEGDVQYLHHAHDESHCTSCLCELHAGAVWELELLAGLADRPSEVPLPIRHAIAGLAAHWYTQRQPVAFGDQTVSVPDHIATVLHPYSLENRVH